MLLAATLCTSCTTAKRTDFVHEPTEGLITKLDIDQPQYERFTHHGVVIWPLPRFRTTGTRIFFESASKTATSVTVSHARLRGIKGQSSNSRETTGPLTLAAHKQQKKPGVHTAGATLFQIDQAELEAMGEGGGLRLSVTFRVGDVAEDTTMDYDLARRVSSQLVSH